MDVQGSQPQGERRRHHRFDTMTVATLNCANVFLPCIVTDVSRGGARIRLLEGVSLPRDPLVLQSARYGVVTAEVVWQIGVIAGLKFAVELAAPIPAAAPLAA